MLVVVSGVIGVVVVVVDGVVLVFLVFLLLVLFVFVLLVFGSSCSVSPPKVGRELMSPPCLESQGCQFGPTFLYLLSCPSA